MFGRRQLWYKIYVKKLSQNQRAHNSALPTYSKKAVDAIYDRCNISSWGYRKTDLALTKTTVRDALSGFKALAFENPIFDELENKGRESRMDPYRLQFNELERFVNGSWWPNIKKRAQEKYVSSRATSRLTSTIRRCVSMTRVTMPLSMHSGTVREILHTRMTMRKSNAGSSQEEMIPRKWIRGRERKRKRQVIYDTSIHISVPKRHVKEKCQTLGSVHSYNRLSSHPDSDTASWCSCSSPSHTGMFSAVWPSVYLEGRPWPSQKRWKFWCRRKAWFRTLAELSKGIWLWEGVMVWMSLRLYCGFILRRIFGEECGCLWPHFFDVGRSVGGLKNLKIL